MENGVERKIFQLSRSKSQYLKDDQACILSPRLATVNFRWNSVEEILAADMKNYGLVLNVALFD